MNVARNSGVVERGLPFPVDAIVDDETLAVKPTANCSPDAVTVDGGGGGGGGGGAGVWWMMTAVDG